MALPPGTRIGTFEITGSLGAGGMGEVYRARDTRLHREVALKILPEAFAADPERLARFEREARVLASLNHPHIASIHGFEESDDVRALVLELVEGETLADRIGSSRIALDEALPVARQIAEALQAAHEQGIVHRDLKPANIKITPDGVVKVLDFGLAKLTLASRTGKAGEPDIAITTSPTVTSPALMTGVGVLLGTASYMSPEQAKGREADKRSDVWAFGCVLYEMLTGQRAFDGEDMTEVLGAVVRLEPNWTALPSQTPQAIRALLEACLAKDRRHRVADISAALFVLGNATTFDRAPHPPRKQARLVVALGVLAGAALAFGATWLASGRSQVAPAQQARFAIVLPPAQSVESSVAQDTVISPDGGHVVYVVDVAGRTQLAIRAIAELEARLLPGTEGGSSPFISPDSRWIGFFINVGGGGGEIKTLPITGGPSTTVCRYKGNPAGASWGTDDTIVFATTDLTTGLFGVPSAGGEPNVLTTPDRARGDVDHRYPIVLPGAKAVLFSHLTAGTNQVAVLEFETRQHRSLISGGLNAHYVDPGLLVYAVDDTLRAVRFGLDSLSVAGDAVSVLEGVRGGPAVLAAADFSVSRGGALVYVPGEEPGVTATRSLVWVTRRGLEEAIKAPPRAYVIPRISPDGRRVALDVRDQQADIWIWDLERENFTRLTSDQQNDRNPVWMPDSQRIAFASNRRAGSLSLYWQRADGIGQAEPLATAPGFMIPTSVSPDGSRVVLMENLDITLVTVAGVQAAPQAGVSAASNAVAFPLRSEPLIATAFSEDNPEISPDGQWLAYQSNESGQAQIYVRSFPNVDGFRLQISTEGGRMPAWSRNGRELFYLGANDMLTSVPVQTGATFSAGKPLKILDTAYYPGLGNRGYDVSPDGQRFLMIKPNPKTDSASESSRASLVVVLNWLEELKRLLPGD